VTSRIDLPTGIQLCLEDIEKSTVNAYGVPELLATPKAALESRSIVSTLEQSLGGSQRKVKKAGLTNQHGYGGHEILEIAQEFAFLVGGASLLTGTFALIRKWLAIDKDRKVSLRYASGEDGQLSIDLSGFTEERAIWLVEQLLSCTKTKGPAARAASGDFRPRKKETEQGRHQWDVFLSYPRKDAASAKELHDHLVRLKPGIAVFLDTVALTLGDDWTTEIKAALESTRLVVALVSSSTEEAYYQQEEFTVAISLARKNPDVRVIPVYVDDRGSDSPPLGLSLKHSINAQAAGGLEAVAKELLRV